MPVLGHSRDEEADYTGIYHLHFIKTLLHACAFIITSFFLNVNNFRPPRPSEKSVFCMFPALFCISPLLLAFRLPRLRIVREPAGLGSRHRNGHLDRYFPGTANDPAELFFCNPNRLSDQLGDAVSPKA